MMEFRFNSQTEDGKPVDEYDEDSKDPKDSTNILQVCTVMCMKEDHLPCSTFSTEWKWDHKIGM